MKWSAYALIFCFATTMFAKEVENGKKPKGKPHTLKFTEDLRFGADEEEEVYLWPSSGTLVVPDDDGHMYVVNVQDSQILEFDEKGKFVGFFGKSGQGPGEYQGARGLTFLHDGSAIGFDLAGGQLGSLKLYDKERKYLDTRSALGSGIFPSSLVVSPKGNLMGAVYVSLDQANGKLITKTGIVSPEFKEIERLTEHAGNLPDQSRFQDPNFWVEFISDQLQVLYKAVGFFNFDASGNLYSAVSNKYEITKWDPEMKTKLMVVKRDYQPIPYNQSHLDGLVELMSENILNNPLLQNIVTKTHLQKAVERSNPPKVKNPVFGMIPMEGGKLLVVHDLDFGSREQSADIFSEEGAFLGQVSMKDSPFLAPANSLTPRMTFKNGFAYTVETDDLGDNRVVRYRYELVPQ